MRPSKFSSGLPVLYFLKSVLFSFFSQRPRRKLACFAIIFNLLIWPLAGTTLRPILDPASALASAVGYTANAVSSTASKLRFAFSGLATSMVFIPTGPIAVPVPLLPIWPVQLSTPTARELTMDERIARVAFVKISPHKLVGYAGESVTFVAMGVDPTGQSAHGAKFNPPRNNQLKTHQHDERGRDFTVAPSRN